MKVISVTPAGRRKYLEILVPYLLKERDKIQEHHFWINTIKEDDIRYMEGLCKQYSFFKMIHPKIPVNGNRSIYHFYKDYVDEDTIYIRLDDDICWLREDAINNLIKARISNPDPFLVFANIINNGVCNHLHQRFGIIPMKTGALTYNAVCPLSWGCPLVAEKVHKVFLSNNAAKDTDKYLFDKWVLWDYNRFSVNCFSWFGKKFKEFSGEVGIDEELFLSRDIPQSERKPNIICGKALMSHFAYYPQRDHLETTTLLDQYRKLSEGEQNALIS